MNLFSRLRKQSLLLFCIVFLSAINIFPMSLILAIETATEVCSVSLINKGLPLATRESAGSNEHSKLLTPFINEVVLESGFNLNEINAVAVSMGPGSYTGLRIGVSAAKGLCFSLDIPLIAISTLKALTYKALNDEIFQLQQDNKTLYCPMIDARRMEVYTALFDQNFNEIKPVQAVVINENSFAEVTTQTQLIIFGNGASKCRDILMHNKNITIVDNIRASAKAMALFAESSYQSRDFVNTAYFEPFYLKDFIAGKPNVKGLHVKE